MKKLITLGEKVDLLAIAYNLNGGAFVMQEAFELIEYKRFLDQPLAKEMFEGDKAIFVGFRKGRDLMEHVFTNNELNVKILFMNDGTCIECIDSFGYLKNFAIKDAKIHDLAELTKSNPLTLK